MTLPFQIFIFYPNNQSRVLYNLLNTRIHSLASDNINRFLKQPNPMKISKHLQNTKSSHSQKQLLVRTSLQNSHKSEKVLDIGIM